MPNLSSPELPPDILGEIFLLCAFMIRDRQTQTSLYDGSATLRSISQVCTLWREVALSDTFIWAQVVEISVGKKRWREEVLRRSGSRSISATVVLWPFGYHKPLPPLRYNEIAYHAQFNYVTPSLTSHQEAISWIRSSIEENAPTLTSLSIHFPQGVTTISLFPVDPDSVLNGKLPLLHHLRLTGCLHTFRVLLFHQLISLDIELLPPASTWDPALLVQALQGMPALTSLRLHDAASLTGGRVGDGYSFIRHRSQDNVDLPHLSVFFISGSLDIIAHLLEVINWPSTCSVSILSSLLSNDRMLPEIRQVIRGAMLEWPPDYHVGWSISTPYSGMTTLSSLHMWPDVRLGSFTLTMQDAQTATFLPLLGKTAQALRLESGQRIGIPLEDIFSDFLTITTLVYPDVSVIKFLVRRMSENKQALTVPRLHQIHLNDNALFDNEFTSILDELILLRSTAELPGIGIFEHGQTEYVSGLSFLKDMMPRQYVEGS